VHIRVIIVYYTSQQVYRRTLITRVTRSCYSEIFSVLSLRFFFQIFSNPPTSRHLRRPCKLVRCHALGSSGAEMERRFSIEAKSFRFSTKDGSSLFWLEERRKKFVGYIFVSPQCSSWLIDTVEAACMVKENIAKSFREGDKALMVHGGDNKAGRFLEVAVFAEGGRKGGLWLPEGRDGRGWRRFADELRILVASPDGGPVESEFRPSPCSKSSPTKITEAGVSRLCSKARTFAEILASKPQLCGEKKTSGVDLQREAAGSVKSIRGSDVKG
jgi:hypothetical protein